MNRMRVGCLDKVDAFDMVFSHLTSITNIQIASRRRLLCILEDVFHIGSDEISDAPFIDFDRLTLVVIKWIFQVSMPHFPPFAVLLTVTRLPTHTKMFTTKFDCIDVSPV